MKHVLGLGGLLALWLLRNALPRRGQRIAKLPASEERVVILGASTLDGLGAALLKQCLLRGTEHLMIVGRRRDALEQVRDHMLAQTAGRRSARAHVEIVCAELTSSADIAALRDRILQQWGGLDTLHIVFGVTSILPVLGVADVDPCGVNASGAASTDVHPTREGLDRIAAAVRRSSDGNLTGTAMVLGALVPILQTTSAHPAVVVIGSVAGLVPAPTRAVYCATKASQHFLVRSVELECESQAGTLVPGTQRRRARVPFLLVAPGPIQNSFVATYAVDARTGPRDNRENALKVHDVISATLARLDHAQWGTLVMPTRAYVASLLAQVNATYVWLLTQARLDWVHGASTVQLLTVPHEGACGRPLGGVHARRKVA
ncbi:hypothetical protein MCAP1_003473 [Malassezia caprae]|uniref:Uncharacterized protein n=1 Tax=Malassezia caprae TaxID=1381934 RepID=A0AAF0EEW4_9BASI|nr:hypothetical protein MCAP1_003473 [Malassezia caprae]